jgi:hypothetical protein
MERRLQLDLWISSRVITLTMLIILGATGYDRLGTLSAALLPIIRGLQL